MNNKQNEREPLSLQVDLVFKAVFGQDTLTSKTLLIDLLNTILNRTDSNQIISLTHNNPFNLRLAPGDKESILDLKVQTDKGESIDVEMQISFSKHFHKRSLYYWSLLHSSQLEEGDKFSKLKKSICINIMSAKCFTDINEPLILFTVQNCEHKITLSNDLEIYYVQLPAIDDTIEAEAMDKLTEWMTFIKDIHLKEKQSLIQKIAAKEGVMQMAYDEYSKVNNDKLMREKLEARQKFIWDMNSANEEAIEEAHAEGREEGREEGHLEEKTSLAKKMKASGYDIAEIARLTGISENSINNL